MLRGGRGVYLNCKLLGIFEDRSAINLYNQGVVNMSSMLFSTQGSKFLKKYANLKHIILKSLLIFYISRKHERSYITSFESFYHVLSLNMDLILPGYKQLLQSRKSAFDELEDTSISMIENIYYNLMDLNEFICNDSIFSEVYEALLDRSYKKINGIYYTPGRIARYMVNRVMEGFDAVSFPFSRVLDISCGCGNFLSSAFDNLLRLYAQKTPALQEKYGFIWSEEKVKKHIIENNLFGADIDEIAVEITVIRLILKSWGVHLERANIIVCNSLIKYESLDSDCLLKRFWSMDFDYVVANPPYLNMQSSSSEMKKYVKDNYQHIFTGENDLYYYFIYRCVEKLKISGKMSLLVPIYFIEATYGSKLRRFIEENMAIDFFKDMRNSNLLFHASIHCCILSGTKKDPGIKPDKKVSIRQNRKLFLGRESWVIGEEQSLRIIDKLSKFNKLRDYACICKGMDTGLNKCFLVDDITVKKYGIENELVRDAIRSSDIKPYFTGNHKYSILYITDATDISRFPNAYSYIRQFKDELQKRWSCRNKHNSWYSMSTLRNRTYFESSRNRLFSPYRSAENKFTLDCRCSIGLTDTTAIFPHNNINVYYLAGLLNSRLLSFYNMICGKRKGDMYEFFSIPLSQYPICIDSSALSKIIIDRVYGLIHWDSLDKSLIKKYRSDIDNAVYEIFGINSREVKIVERYFP